MASFGDIPSNLVLGAGQSVRRNATDDAFEAYTPGSGGGSYTFVHSLYETGGSVSLVNDAATPGNLKYYGTNGSGTKGFYDLPTTMVYPGAGIALSTGSAWGTSITDNSANWNTAFGWGNHATQGYLTALPNHDLVNTTHHPVSGLTTGHFLKATGATSYAFAAHGLSAGDVGAEPAITKSQGYAYYTGSAWSFLNETYALSTHNHDTTYFKQGGNSFGATAVLGTTDNYDLQLKTNDIQWGVLKNTGELGIGRETTAQQRLTIHYGNLRFNSIPQPGNHTASLAGLGAGNLENGLYYYSCIPVTIYGDCGYDQRSNSSVIITDKTTNGQVRLTNLPVFAAKYQVIARKIYRTRVGESNTWARYLTIINDNTTTEYVDNTPDASLPDGRVYGKPDKSTGLLYKDGNLMMLADTYNTSFGQGALQNAIACDGITAIGAGAGAAITDAIGGIFIGGNAGFHITTGSQNVMIGAGASGLTTGSYNIGIGGGMSQGVGSTVSYTIALGREAGGRVTGDYNIYIGRYAGRYQGSGIYNIGIGSNVFHGVSGTTPTGSYNLVMGYLAMGSGTLTSAANNTALGYLSLRFATTASNNVAVGNSAGTSITTGQNNTLIGYGVSTSITEGSRNLIIGRSVDVSSSVINDEFRLGYSTTLLLNGHMGTNPFLNVPVEFRTAGDVVFNGIGTATESNVLYYNTTTNKVTYGAIPTPYTFQHSITASGTTVNLVNDTATPGNSKYYGTNSGGTRGWYDLPSGGGMVYPGAGIAVSTGSAWGTSITDNSANWNTAYGWGNHAGLYEPTITAGTTSQYWRGDKTWQTFPTIPTIGGSNTHVQYNNSGAFAGSAKFTWNDSTGVMTLNNTIQSPDGIIGDVNGKDLYLQAGNPYTTNIPGKLYLIPGVSSAGLATIHLGNTSRALESVTIEPSSSESNVEVILRSKGISSAKLLSNYGSCEIAIEAILLYHSAGATYIGRTTFETGISYFTTVASSSSVFNHVGIYGSTQQTAANKGGSVFISGGLPGSGGTYGDIYFGRWVDEYTNPLGTLPAKSSETNVVYYNTSTGKLSYGTVSAGTTYTFQYSLSETAGIVNLVNDSASPGNNKLYGTNGSGTRGWYDIPAAGVTPVDGIFDWDTNVYKPYASKQSSLHHFYAGTTNPDNTTRLNLDGYLYATRLYDNASRVITEVTLPTATDYQQTRYTDGSMPNAGTWYNAVTQSSLPAGRYLVTANMVIRRATTTITIYTGRIRLIDNTSGVIVYPAQSQGNFSSQNPHLVEMSFSCIINIHNTSTVYLDAVANQSNCTILAAPSYSSQATGQLTYMRLVRLSDYVAASISGTTYLSFPVGGSTEYINMVANTSWYVVSKPSWITLTPSASGLSERVTVTASNNLSGVVRTGSIIFRSLDNNATLTTDVYQDEV